MMIESHMHAAVNNAAGSRCHVRAHFRGPESASGYPARVGGIKNIFHCSWSLPNGCRWRRARRAQS